MIDPEKIKIACLLSVEKYGNQDAKDILFILDRLERAEALCRLVGKVDLRDAGRMTVSMVEWRSNMNRAFFDWLKAIER